MHVRRVGPFAALLATLVAPYASAIEEPTNPTPAPPTEPEQGTPTPAEGTAVPPQSPGPLFIATPAPPPASAPLLIVAVPAEPPPPPSFRIEGAGGSTIRLGILLQPQYQAVNSAALDSYSHNLYVRRMRILVGGTLFGMFDYFVDTDYPNLFLPSTATSAGGTPTFQKNTPGMNIQDAFATWRAWRDMVKVDVGYMLPSLAHNSLQGATTLYSWDYFAYAFQQGNMFGSAGNPVGRDVGVQLRGLLVGGHLEYRAGLFQGLRRPPTGDEVGARNFFRFAARIQVNLLDPEPGFFYQGTYLGTRRVLSVGGAVDLQDSYRYFGGDVFADLPIGPMGVVTAQVNLVHMDGDDFIPTLLKQTALMSEAGFLFSAFRLGPIVRFEHLWGSNTLSDQTRYVAGLAFWPFGHNSNVKAFYSRIDDSGADRGINQFNVQWQLYAY